MNVPCEFRSRRVAVCGHGDAGPKRRGVRLTPPWRAVRDPEPVGRRLGPAARRARLRGACDDELRLRLHARPPRRWRDARRGGRARRARRRATQLPVSVDLENGYGPEPEAAAPAIARGRRGGRRRRLDRGLGPAGASTSRRTPPSGSRRPPRRAGAGFPFRSRPAPRITSAATPTSTTRSPGCRPTRRRARTCSTRRPRDRGEIRAVCEAVWQAGQRARPARTLRSPRSPGRAPSGSASAARSPGWRSRRSSTAAERDSRPRRLLRCSAVRPVWI